MERCVLVLSLLLVATALQAQNLWLRSDKYFYEPGDECKVELVSGEDFIPTPVPFDRNDALVVEFTHRNTVTDIRRNFTEGDKASFNFTLSNEGFYSYYFQAAEFQRKMGAESFTLLRKKSGYDDPTPLNISDSVELSFNQMIKGYVRVGKQIDKRPEEIRKLPLEIMPDKNPLTLKKGDKIVFTVYKDGTPVFGTRVTVWNRWNNRTTIQNIYTEKDGTVSTHISSPGDWMVSVTSMQEATSRSRYVVESFNLVFGYR